MATTPSTSDDASETQDYLKADAKEELVILKEQVQAFHDWEAELRETLEALGLGWVLRGLSAPPGGHATRQKEMA